MPEGVFTNGTDVRKGVPGVLYRNGSPISGRKAFEQNVNDRISCQRS